MTRIHQVGIQAASQNSSCTLPDYYIRCQDAGSDSNEAVDLRSVLTQKKENLVGQLMENGSNDVLRKQHLEGMVTAASDATPTRQSDATFKRKQAADWIESVTGLSVPSSSDHDFRAALRDGAVLCNLLDALKPNGVSSTANGGNNVVNISRFLIGLQSLGFPSDLIFSASDLESEGWEDRPRIVDCLLHLKYKLDVIKQSMASGMPTQNHSTLSLVADSSLPTSLSAHSPPKSPASEQLTVSNRFQNVSSPHLMAAAAKGMHANVGVTNLMRHCTQLLQEKMWVDCGKRQQQVAVRPNAYVAAADSNPSEALGPVLESVLHSLTQEYEKRLLAKDHELTAIKEKFNRLEIQYDAKVLEIAKLKAELSDKRANASAHAAAEGKVVAERLRVEVQHLQDRLRQKEQQLEAQRKERDFQSSKYQEELVRLQAEHMQLKLIENKYKRVVEENRSLYNQVQDLKGSIRVFCRVRPLGKTGDSSASCLDIGTDGELALYDPLKHDRKIFRFDKIFDMDSTQDQVYDEVQGLVRSVLDGYNVCIFAYGQTGSGKTHTMSGTNVHTLEGRGMNYRALDDLFNLQRARSAEVEYNIVVQMLEIYNENLRDLLIDPSASSRPKTLDILNTQASGCNVPGAVQVEVFNAEDVVTAMDRGASNRAVGETRLNERSSRSHQILSVIVDGHHTATGARTHGCLHLIDLAGSERVAKSEATGDRLVEAQHINRSLSALGDVMSALASKTSHVPFRNSKLTQLLQDSLSGQAKVMMFMHIAPESSSHGESLSTLKFGTRVSEIVLGQAKKNVESGKVFAAHEQLQKMQQACEDRGELCKQLQGEVQNAQKQLKQTQQQVEQERSLRAADAARLQRAESQVAELQAELEALRQKQLQQQYQPPAPVHTPPQNSYQPSSSHQTSAIQSTESTCSTPQSVPVLSVHHDAAEPTRFNLRPSILPTQDGTSTHDSAENVGTPANCRELESTSSVASHATPRFGPDRSMSSYQRHLERMKANRSAREEKNATPLPGSAPPSSRTKGEQIGSAARQRPSGTRPSSCPQLQLDLCTPRSTSLSPPITPGIKSVTELSQRKMALAGQGWR